MTGLDTGDAETPENSETTQEPSVEELENNVIEESDITEAIVPSEEESVTQEPGSEPTLTPTPESEPAPEPDPEPVPEPTETAPTEGT